MMSYIFTRRETGVPSLKTKEHYKKKEDNCDIIKRVKRFRVSQLAVFMFNNPGI